MGYESERPTEVELREGGKRPFSTRRILQHLIAFCVSAAVVVLVLQLLFAHQWNRRQSQFLPDGTRVSLADVQVGDQTSFSTASWLYRALTELVPDRHQRDINKLLGPAVSIRRHPDTEHMSVILLFEERCKSPVELLIRDDSGWESTAYPDFASGTVLQLGAFRFDWFPEGDRRFEAVLQEQPPGGGGTPGRTLATFHFRSRGHTPKEPSRATPKLTTGPAGRGFQYSNPFRLESLRTGIREDLLSGSLSLNGHLDRAATALRGNRIGTVARIHGQLGGNHTPDWQPLDLVLSDIYGSVGRVDSLKVFTENGDVMCWFYPPLYSGEGPFNLRFTGGQSRNFAADELWHLDVRLPAPGEKTTEATTTTIQGLSIKFGGIASPTYKGNEETTSTSRRRSTRYAGDDNPPLKTSAESFLTMFVEQAERGEDELQVRLVSAQTSDGKSLLIPERAVARREPLPDYSKGYSHQLFLQDTSLPAGTSVSITLAITPVFTLKFVAEAEKQK